MNNIGGGAEYILYSARCSFVFSNPGYTYWFSSCLFDLADNKEPRDFIGKKYRLKVPTLKENEKEQLLL